MKKIAVMKRNQFCSTVSVVLETEEGETTLVVNSETEIDMIYENCELDE